MSDGLYSDGHLSNLLRDLVALDRGPTPDEAAALREAAERLDPEGEDG